MSRPLRNGDSRRRGQFWEETEAMAKAAVIVWSLVT